MVRLVPLLSSDASMTGVDEERSLRLRQFGQRKLRNGASAKGRLGALSEPSSTLHHRPGSTVVSLIQIYIANRSISALLSQWLPPAQR